MVINQNIMTIKPRFRCGWEISFALFCINVIIISKIEGSFFSAPYLYRPYLKCNKTIDYNFCAKAFEPSMIDFSGSLDVKDSKEHRRAVNCE